MKTWDLTKSHKYVDKLQKNISNLSKEYGGHFTIHYKHITVNVKLCQRKLPNGVKYFQIYTGDSSRTTDLRPFAIDFVDIKKAILNDNAYIANIHKHDKYSGSDLVELCLAICRTLDVDNVYIGDGTIIQCERDKYDLSFLKLIETRKTFYMRFGFENNPVDHMGYYQFKNIKELQVARNKLITNIRKIRISDLIREYSTTLMIINRAISENNKHSLKIMLAEPSFVDPHNFYTKANPINDIIDLFHECHDMLALLHKYSNYKLLWELMVYLFKENCGQYGIINRYITENKRIEIHYGTLYAKRHYIIDFILLKELRYGGYVCKLRKK